MAFYGTGYCHVCKQATQWVDGNCTLCKQRAEFERKEALRKQRQSMTLEERIEAVEEWIDNFKHRHVPPPKF